MYEKYFVHASGLTPAQIGGFVFCGVIVGLLLGLTRKR